MGGWSISRFANDLGRRIYTPIIIPIIIGVFLYWKTIKKEAYIMKGIKRKSIALMATLVMLMTSVLSVSAAVSDTALDAVIQDAASYMSKTVVSPQVGSVGGEWAVIALARSSYEMPSQYYEKYYERVKDHVKTHSGDLHDKKYTEYSRIALALTAIGKDPTDVAGYNLLTALGDYDKTTWQGLNGPVWALIALDSGNYPMPQNPEASTQATRQMYVDRILECQLPDGGWSLLGGTPSAPAGERSDPDITGMVLQALASYQDNPQVKKATGQALEAMSQVQNEKGGFSNNGQENSESLVQMIVGLSELGLSLEDERFIKNGHTLLDNLMTYYKKGNGFSHTLAEGGSNQMATEQGLYGAVAAERMRSGKNSLYRMNDTQKVVQGEMVDQSAEIGLPGKHKDIKLIPVTVAGRSFDDIASNKHKEAIEALASRQIINGKSATIYDPLGAVTRAEFATIIVNSLGLKPASNSQFKDVPESIWYAPYVGAASQYGLVAGVSETTFNPKGTITKQEAAVMITRAAALSGLDTGVDELTTRDVLAQFTDYVTSAPWARPSLAFAYAEDILDQADIDIKPKAPMNRGEIAQMVFNMLGIANLL